MAGQQPRQACAGRRHGRAAKRDQAPRREVPRRAGLLLLHTRLELDLSDPVLPENAGRWVLEVHDGKARHAQSHLRPARLTEEGFVERRILGQHRHEHLVIGARGVGQVRDLLAGAGSGRSQMETYPTVRAAVAALTGSSDPAPPADTDRG